MGEFQSKCKCCLKSVKVVYDEIGSKSFNLDGSEHEKHFRIWAVSVASFINQKTEFTERKPDELINDMTFEELKQLIDNQTKLKLGSYYHGQTSYREEWLSPKSLQVDNTIYYVGGVIDGKEEGKVVELKTTWVTNKSKIKNVIIKAQTQADIYAWIDNSISEVKIEVVNLAKPNLSTISHYRPEPGHVPEYLHRYIKEQKNSIKQYNF